MTEDTEPQEIAEMDVEQAEIVQEIQEAPQETVQVPLSALQKERKKRQELEAELNWERRRQQQAAQSQPEEEDNSRYESATKADLLNAQQEAMRAFEEKMWIKNNMEKFEKVRELLPEFLKQRPNLASAINEATNRYEEAYTLMDALTPKQQAQIRNPQPKKEAPNSPGGIPKIAALNQAVDVMNMSDSDFNAWRKQQKRR